MSQPHHGGCQCGDIRYAITGEPIVTFACHCTICQSQSGSAFGLAMRFHAEDFQISSGQLQSFTRRAESGQVFTNSFCANCGTRIHHHASANPDHLSLKPGTLDDTSWLKPTHHIFARSAQNWFIFPEDAKVFDTAPPNNNWLNGE
ncbi:GFA family protein [Sphingorhabdus sp. EL138]|uniref:GFA family protein n=1 Tax=Sphingorhabdus sp. EL138 TaxID=2073156 RepID=UPI000D698771|nr:GFA family protein [Sphingorhabdus sp. EL138]